MLNLNDKLNILLNNTKGYNAFKLWIERKYKYPFHVLSNYNLNEGIGEYCQLFKFNIESFNK